MTAVPERIPRDEWQVYFAHVTEQYLDWRMTIEVRRGDQGSQQVSPGVPLQMHSVKLHSSAAGALVIEATHPPSASLRHRVDRPRSVWVSDTRPGAESTIFIESDDGTTTLIVLRRPVTLPAPPGGQAD